MSELVADCPRCGSQKMTFDLLRAHLFEVQYDWQQWFEAFCLCRHCARATIFVLSQNEISYSTILKKTGLLGLPSAANTYVEIRGYINLKDTKVINPPEHLPKEIKAAFEEGTRCLSVAAYNGAATMFRLCIDLSTKAMLPKEELAGLNGKVRRDLGLRLPWLFQQNLLPNALQELSSCIKEDGNDGAHTGTLNEEDANDILDFTFVLLERIYTEPKRLELAKSRRENRRAEVSK
jgi:hypothetical protein